MNFDGFLKVESRLNTQKELVNMGSDAIPIIKSFYSGEMKNSDGIAYVSIRTIHQWVLHAIGDLGDIAKPLELDMIEYINEHTIYTIKNLNRFSKIQEKTFELVLKLLEEFAYNIQCVTNVGQSIDSLYEIIYLILKKNLDNDNRFKSLEEKYPIIAVSKSKVKAYL